MGKNRQLDDTLGPYWNNFNANTPRASRNATTKSTNSQSSAPIATASSQDTFDTHISLFTSQQNHPVFQPGRLSPSNTPSQYLDHRSEFLSSTDDSIAPSSLHNLNSYVHAIVPPRSDNRLLSSGPTAGQTQSHYLQPERGVNDVKDKSTVKQAQAVEELTFANTAFKSVLESDSSVDDRFEAGSSASSDHSTGHIPQKSNPRRKGIHSVAARTDYRMSSRPGAGRRAGRDAGKDNDVEAELFNRVLDAVRKAKEYNDECQRLGTEIIALEEEIRSKGKSTTEQHRRLDDLYRQKLRNAEAEKKVHDEEDIVNNLAILATMRSTDDTPGPRAGHNAKSGRGKGAGRSNVDNEAIAESPGPTPSDNRVDILKRGKDRGGTGTPQRSSSVASQHRSGTALAKDEVASSTSTAASATGDTASTQHKGLLAERAGTLIPGVEVFYKFPKGSPDDLGVGIQCIIKKVWADKKPNIIYDVQDPEPDPSGKINVHKATAKDLYPIPSASETKHLPSFPINATVYARYPDTDTFYKAKVVRAIGGGKGDGEKGKSAGEYILRFEGEEDDKEQPVERRFVLDAKMKWSA